MSNNWYYADRAGQQQGPVSAQWLAAALPRGEVSPSTLVWRDGLADWQPLSALAAELGVVLAAAPPPMPPAPRPPGAPVAVAPRGGGGNLLVVLVIIGAVVVFGGGILAAIAIPAYSDYTQRAKLSSAISEAATLRVQVAETRAAHDRCPYNGEDGIGEAESYAGPNVERVVVGALENDPETCAIQLYLRGFPKTIVPDGASLLMKLQQDGSWRYESDVPPRYLPVSVRDALD